VAVRRGAVVAGVISTSDGAPASSTPGAMMEE